MFFPPRYIIRVLKSILFITLFFTLMLCLVYFLSDKRDVNVSFLNLIANPVQVVIFFVLFGIVYPLVSFVKRDVMLVRTFSEERIKILNIFDAMGYELVNETGGVLTFRLKNRFVRIMRLFGEDMIDVEYNAGKVSLSGLRRDIYRLIRHIEYLKN